jgi:putative heme-binding domain-containing protein
MRCNFTVALLLGAVTLAGSVAFAAPSGTLEQRLQAEPAATLAHAARELGDPNRGALVFYQPGLACAKCHLGDGKLPPIGPDLARPDPPPTDEFLVESLLNPSKTIKKGFEAVTIVTVDGATLTGIVVEDRAREIVVRDASHDGKRITIAKADIDERTDSVVSLMPAGLINQLTDRGQFLDLVRYLIEIAEHGPARAVELRPAAALLAPPPLPGYEKQLDHAGLIR